MLIASSTFVMSSRVFKFIFNSYVFAATLCLKWENNQFKVSKFHVIKALILFPLNIFLLYLVTFLSNINNEAIDEQSSLNHSTFSKKFFGVLYFWPFFIVNYWTYVLISIQKEVSVIFNQILKFHKKFPQINLKNIQIKIILLFLYAASYFLTKLFLHFNVNDFKLKDIFFHISNQIIIFAYIFSVTFASSMIFLYDFLLENFNDILSQELNKRIHNHTNCEDFMVIFSQLQKLFDILNRSVAKIFTFYTADVLILIIYNVSCKQILI